MPNKMVYDSIYFVLDDRLGEPLEWTDSCFVLDITGIERTHTPASTANEAYLSG